MPMFDFVCEKCGNNIEKFVRDEKALTCRCEVCGCERVFNKVIGSPNILYYPLNTNNKLPSEFKNRMDTMRNTFNKGMNSKYA